MCMAKKSALAWCFMPPSYLVGHTSPGGRRVMHHHHHIGGYTTHTPTHTHAHTRPPDSPAITSCGEVSSYITTPPQSPWCREIDLGIPKQALFLAVGSGGSALDDHVNFFARSYLSSTAKNTRKTSVRPGILFVGVSARLPQTGPHDVCFVIFGRG